MLLVLALLVVLAIAFVATGWRAIASAGARDEVGRRRFLHAFDARGLSPALLVRTYEALRRIVPVPGRAVRPHTRLAEELGLGLVDAEDVAVLVVDQCGGRIPTGADLDHFGRTVRTVDDLVLYVSAHCPAERAA